MFCPQCKAEYRPGFVKCADCGVDLVPELPPDPEQEPVEWVEVLSTYNSGDIAFLKSLLDSENITYYFHGEHFSAMVSLVQPATLMVDRAQLEVVKTLLKDIQLNFRGIASDE